MYNTFLQEAYDTSADASLRTMRDGLSFCQKYRSLARCCCVPNSSWQHTPPAFTPVLIAYDTLHKSITLTGLSSFGLSSHRVVFLERRRALSTALFRANHCPSSINGAHSLGGLSQNGGLILQKLPAFPMICMDLRGEEGSNSSGFVWRQEEVQT